MTGYPNHNYDAFHAAANKLRASGYDVLCPAENFNGDTSLTYDVYMRQDLVLVSICDAIAMLPGWEQSRGALCELHAAITIGLPVINAATLKNLDVDAGLIGFILWRNKLAGQNRDQRENEEREEYVGILAGATPELFQAYELCRSDQGSVGSTRYQQAGPPATVSGSSPISGD